jgi:hypothetical protein
MSALGHKRTLAVQNMMSALDPKAPQLRMSAKGQKPTCAVHWMILSARTRIESGTARPSILAVFRLITNSNLVG